ncbi:hypothetical protein ACVWXO_001132 [Bradyrhizobium sp. LM2.7]
MAPSQSGKSSPSRKHHCCCRIPGGFARCLGPHPQGGAHLGTGALGSGRSSRRLASGSKPNRSIAADWRGKPLLLSRLTMHKPGRTHPSLQAARALELKHLRSAVAAADCGSVRGAAELLRPQRTISEFEHHLGVPIFERFSGGVRPTRPGCDVLRLARTILEEFDALIATARSVHNSEKPAV